MSPPHTPHDSLVKHIFSNPEAARAELCHALPEALTRRLDWSTLTVEPGSFVDAELRHRASDLLYSVRLHDGGPSVSIYVLLEHQSTVDPLMAVRFLIYVARIYERRLRRDPAVRAVPLVVPVLLFQGRGGWTAPRRLSQCLDLPPALRQALSLPVELSFDLDDLSQSTVERLGQVQLRRDRGVALAELARSLLWLCRHPEAPIGPRAELLAQLVDAVVELWGVHAVRPFFVYLLSAFGPDTPIRGIMLDATNEETTHLYATIREELLAQGRKAGVVEGRRAGVAEGRRAGVAEGKIAILLELLATRGLLLSDAQRRTIEACDDGAQLQRWCMRAVGASSVREVLDG